MESGNRRIAGIHRRLISTADYDRLHNFMTESPWSSEELRGRRLEWIKNQVPNTKESPTVIAIDSTFAHHAGKKIHGVYWFWDYTKRQFCLAQRVVISSLVTPSKLVPLGYRIYHRGFLAEQKLFLEAMQPAEDETLEELETFNDLTKTYEENCKEHKTQLEIAADIVDECEKLGFQKDAYFLDGAFLDKTLMGRIEEYGQAWITRLARSRLVQVATGGFVTVEEFAKTLSKEDFKRIVITTRHREARVYWCFCKNMMLKHWKKLRIVISYDNKNMEGEPYFIISNKTNWVQAQKILQIYTMRDPIEHLIRDQKQELGFEDNQQQMETSLLKHWELTFAAHAFLELCFEFTYPDEMPVPMLETIGQKCRFF
ncbi:MAG: transposase [Candidatus Melainabacteria bacterium]|nr:transposase [Candidatus Melainabacteria bacterium]